VNYPAGTTWSPIGTTPVAAMTSARCGAHMLSTVNAREGFRFVIVDRPVNAGVFREFLKRLITGMDCKVFLLVDGHPAHTPKRIKILVEGDAAAIVLFFLPPYAPGLNPDELARTHLKAQTAEFAAKPKEELKLSAESALHQLQKLLQFLPRFFHAPSYQYVTT
jgi:transposase